jgi:hypothetical protein
MQNLRIRRKKLEPDTDVDEAVKQIQAQEAEALEAGKNQIRAASKIAGKITQLLQAADIFVSVESCLALGLLFANGAVTMGIDQEQYEATAKEFYGRMTAAANPASETPLIVAP